MAQGRTVLLAVRIGEASVRAARTAAWLGKALGARVSVLYVAAELETVAVVAAGAGLDQAEVRKRIEAEARDRADELVRDILGDLPYDVVIAEGDVAEGVTDAAASMGADLIVVGSRGRSAVRSIILGDTARDILRRAPCAVVVVPPGAAEHADAGESEEPQA